MRDDIEQVLIPREEIADRVASVARTIARDLAGPGHRADEPAADGARPPAAPPSGADAAPPLSVTLVPILTGSFIFVADLIRHLPIYLQIRLVSISSYPGTATTSRGARLEPAMSTLPDSLAGEHVLVVDDILDSGQTLGLVTEVLRQRKPAGLRTCVLLRKRRPEAMATPVDYVCFDIPDAFVVGYGLDFNDYYRNLPDIVTLRPEVTVGD